MDDGHILATDGGCILRSQLGNNLLHNLNGELAGVVQTGTRGNSRLSAVSSNLGAVGDIGGLVQDVTHDSVQSDTSLTAQQLGSLQNGVVQRGQLQNIRLSDVVTVLSDFSGDGADFQGLAIRSDTFSDGGQGLGQRCELTELDGLTTVLGDRTLLTELIVNQIGLSLIDQSHVVEGLHFCGQSRQKSSLHFISKQLQVNKQSFHGCYLLSNVRGD